MRLAIIKLKPGVRSLAVGLTLGLIMILTSASVFADEPLKLEPPNPEIHYPELMKDTADLTNPTLVQPVANPLPLIDKFQVLKDNQAAHLRALGVSSTKQEKYFDLLEKQQERLKETITFPTPEEQAPPSEPSLWERLFSTDKVKPEKNIDLSQEVKIPEKPASFSFIQTDEPVRKLDLTRLNLQAHQPVDNKLVSLAGVQVARAVEESPLPQIEDVQADDTEIVITQEMKEIVKALDYDPAKILEFVHNEIEYEPYNGSKKGSVGCLAERRCNDVDTTSLAIALFRAAGMPARYQSSIAVMTVGQLRDLLGVDETRTLYRTFLVDKMPIFTLTNNAVGDDVDAANFDNETFLAVQWMHAQVFVHYDQKGGTSLYRESVAKAQSTDELRQLLSDELKGQWISVDGAVKKSILTQRPVLADQAGFDAKAFWYGVLRYNGELTPLGKYVDDLQRTTGLQFTNNLSTKAVEKISIDKLPSTLPYYIAEGEDDGVVYPIEHYSELADARRNKLTLTLKRASNNETVLEKTFLASEVNNLPLNLAYEGATEVDKAVIEEHGGIQSTPAPLVDLVPHFYSDYEDYRGVNNPAVQPRVAIGESLILSFNFSGPNNLTFQDEKYSTAGNSEGIYMIFSRVQEDALLDNPENPDRYGQVLAGGTSTLAREYLRRISAESDFLKQSLNYEYHMNFARAVVTQTRILNEVDGFPTTFDFKGLSLDAGVYITDYSNRGNYKTHSEDFRLIWGASSSHSEGQLFKDIAGLESIATVQGLQYAYAHPELYTVHTITAANEGQIDQLNLSADTKTNMHNDVADGNTIITADQLIQRGSWNGTLYISLNPDWTARYAIGEQVAQNGSFSTVDFDEEVYTDEDNAPHTVHKVLVASAGCSGWDLWLLCVPFPQPSFVTFTDSNSSNEVIACRIYSTTKSNLEQWQRDNGFEYLGTPCQTGTTTFGTVRHYFEHYTSGARLAGRNLLNNASIYDYATTASNARAIITRDLPGRSYTSFKFNIIAGTYSAQGHTALRGYYTDYYQPANPLPNGQPQAVAWEVTGDMLSKLGDPSYKAVPDDCGPADASYCGKWSGKKSWVLYRLGYPTSSEGGAAQSQPFETEGSYQNFIGGQLYTDETWINETYYVPGTIGTEYNLLTCQEINGQQVCGRGTGSPRGFPVSDPVYSDANNWLFQDFENGDRIKYLDAGAIQVDHNVQTYAAARNAADPANRDDIIEGFLDVFTEQDIVGISINVAAGVSIDQVAKAIKTYLVKNAGKKALAKVAVRFVPYVGWAVAGASVALAANQVAEVHSACNTDPDLTPLIEGKSPAYYCGKMGAYAVSVAAGIGANKLMNTLGVQTKLARYGKAKFMGLVKNKSDLLKVKNILQSSSTLERTRLFETVERVTVEDVVILTERDEIIQKFMDSDRYAKTWNGFVKGGDYAGYAKRYVDPDIAKLTYKGTPEFQLYDKPNAFDLPAMKAAGITRDGFYGPNDLPGLLARYGDLGEGGEIIFVMKTNGQIIISPRRLNDKLPHPYLAGGEDVIAAGTIEPGIAPNSIVLSRKTGHYKVDFDELKPVQNFFSRPSFGFSVTTDPSY